MVAKGRTVQNCEICTKKNLWTTTPYYEDGRRWWQCRNCGHDQLEVPAQGLQIPAKVVYIDIETAMMKVYAYDLYVPSKRIAKDMIAQNSFVICWSAAWLDENHEIKRMVSRKLEPNEARKQNDKRIVSEIHEILDSADVIVGHNSNNFDLKVLNWRFLLHGLPFPDENKKKIDTYRLSGKTRPPSRGLEPLSVALGGNPKKGLDRAEWIEIVEKGTPKLLAKANRYCRGDVREGVGLFQHYAAAIEASGKRLYR